LRDGIGRPVVADHAYFILATDKVSDCAVWWLPNGFGYTANLDDAGTFFGHELVAHLACRPGDLAWPVDWVNRRRIAHVRVADLRRGS
jgi:hypothetical protein